MAKFRKQTSIQKYPLCRFHYLHCLKISLCWYGHLQYPNILCVYLDHQSKSTNVDLNLKPTPFSLSISILSLSPQCATSRSLSLCYLPNSPYVLPVLIPHKKCMMSEYDYHWLTNIWGRTCCFTGNLLTIVYLVSNWPIDLSGPDSTRSITMFQPFLQPQPFRESRTSRAPPPSSSGRTGSRRSPSRRDDSTPSKQEDWGRQSGWLSRQTYPTCSAQSRASILASATASGSQFRSGRMGRGVSLARPRHPWAFPWVTSSLTRLSAWHSRVRRVAIFRIRWLFFILIQEV